MHGLIRMLSETQGDMAQLLGVPVPMARAEGVAEERMLEDQRDCHACMGTSRAGEPHVPLGITHSRNDIARICETEIRHDQNQGFWCQCILELCGQYMDEETRYVGDGQS